MGWIADDPRHEGYLVAVVQSDSGLWRELGYPHDERPRQVSHVSVGCDCGWRSPRIEAPFGTRWVPFMVVATDAFTNDARKVWQRHVEQDTTR